MSDERDRAYQRERARAGEAIALRLEKYAREVRRDAVGLEQEATDAEMFARWIRDEKWWEPE